MVNVGNDSYVSYLHIHKFQTSGEGTLLRRGEEGKEVNIMLLTQLSWSARSMHMDTCLFCSYSIMQEKRGIYQNNLFTI